MSKKQEFKLVNTDDANEMHNLESTNLKDAALEALEILGWGISVECPCCDKDIQIERKKNKAGD